ncbi:MAG: hypothetical protein KatS3mg115_0170 [Candidatus Poribacteria bacterium]|nr:MAG: hypothetical protein KatS3mg115_0170 [Candidatus Poribacteria bacterium]
MGYDISKDDLGVQAREIVCWERLWKQNRLLTALRERIVIGDGAMGSYLHAQGIPIDANFELLNRTRPELIRAIHEEYLAAGAEAIETNTYAANRYRLAEAGAPEAVAEVNRLGAELAREAAGLERFVLGAIGPIGTRGELPTEGAGRGLRGADRRAS